MASLRRCAFALALLLCVSFVHAQTHVSDLKTINPTFTTIDVPGAGETFVQGINTAGNMVGNYAATLQSPAHGFLSVNGVFSYLDYPGAYDTFTNGINDSGTIVGYAEFSGGTTALGFFYDGVSYTTFHRGNNSGTYALAIDNAGDAAGGSGSLGETIGFELRGNHFKSLSPPGSYVYVYATAINNLGEVVGWTATSVENGFAYKNGKYQTISVSGANDTEAHGVNDGGVIVGWYLMGSSVYGFAVMKGKYVSFGYPGAAGTLPSGINASGQIVGSYTFDFSTYHGFVTSPITTEDFG